MILLMAPSGHSWDNFGLGRGFMQEFGLNFDKLWVFSSLKCLTHKASQASGFVILQSLGEFKQASRSNCIKAWCFHLCLAYFEYLTAGVKSIEAVHEGSFSNFILFVLR